MFTLYVHRLRRYTNNVLNIDWKCIFITSTRIEKSENIITLPQRSLGVRWNCRRNLSKFSEDRRGRWVCNKIEIKPCTGRLLYLPLIDLLLFFFFKLKHLRRLLHFGGHKFDGNFHCEWTFVVRFVCFGKKKKKIENTDGQRSDSILLARYKNCFSYRFSLGSSYTTATARIKI